MIAENRSSGWSDYVYANGGRLARATGSASTGTVYYHGDHLGTARMETNAAGTVIAQCTYAPFGQVVTCPTDDGANHYRFTSQERDTETGLDNFRAREFTSQFGRFSQPDPAGLAAVDLSDPQSLNRYSYVRNNPSNLIDPLGLESGDPCTVVDSHNVNCPGTTITVHPTPPLPPPPQCFFLGLCDASGFGNSVCGYMPYGCSNQGGIGIPSGGGGGGPTNQQTQPTPKPQPCAQPNWLDKLEIPVLQAAAAYSKKTVGIGLNFAGGVGGGMGYAGGGSGYLVVSPSGSAAFVFTVSTTPGFGAVVGAGVVLGPSVLVSTASDPSQLAGWSHTVGISGGVGFGGSGDVSTSSGPNGVIFTGTGTPGFAAGLPGNGHAVVLSSTSVVPVCGHS